ncbi:hypothetical protein EMIHUDRAFT_215475 [Emiliania huxleyi CCMP1516]|uniref:SET domain-containing protein n=2 Tax=Emiliania huxleyi TaxID=2903 RepID=A0A0D3IHF1_EMIH1|nr:hypothetical protein EMIHUDRAFT_215475 [Emiliania huxleyi CCMP1516]EOD10686.1 hypothetical protein EMIHUDRAFT_215475 [Emiliania huxleyi CCMP1516]|eukprot:XP_005763115.1 hypothetical protein EMIHUDRAFT_215475 [Emiliania huxleyi CCMP1516]
MVEDAFAAVLCRPRCEVTLRTAPSGHVSLRTSVVHAGDGCWRSARMGSSAAAGRFMVAASQIAPDDVVCDAPAYCVCTFEEWRKRVCASCFSLGSGRLTVRCPNCEHAFYCSEQCRTRHRIEGSVGSAPHGRVCAALRCFAPLRKYGKSTANPKEAQEWARVSAAFRTLLSRCDWWHAPPPSDDELFALVSRLDSNIFGCFVRDDGAIFGHACYLQAATFNHSCEPNCVAMRGVARMRIVAQEAVAAGEPLTISYIDANRPVHARRKDLSDHYHFTCDCPRCTAEAANGAVRTKLTYGGGGALRRDAAGKDAPRRGGVASPLPKAPPPPAAATKPTRPWFEALA